MSTKTVLVTGGLGYIGSHTVLELFNKDYIASQNLNETYEVVIADNCSNCSPKMLEILESILNRKLKFYNVDLCDKAQTETIFRENKLDAVIHFAAKKSVFESVTAPLLYYRNNMLATHNLLELCRAYDVRNFIFSSTCCVYGNTDQSSTEEKEDLRPLNPYGRSKLFDEMMIKDVSRSNPTFKSVILRYCNVVGNVKSAEIGEAPTQKVTFLFPIIAEHIRGIRDKIYIFGSDYATKDGYAVRDYIHVTDIARGHIAAMKVFTEKYAHLLKDNNVVYNLGTNNGYSVKEIVDTYQEVTGLKFNIENAPRRIGDAANGCPNCEKVTRELGWKAEASLKDICTDCYNFIKKYPKGMF